MNFASCGAMWSRNTAQNQGERNPRSPPCGHLNFADVGLTDATFPRLQRDELGLPSWVDDPPNLEVERKIPAAMNPLTLVNRGMRP